MIEDNDLRLQNETGARFSRDLLVRTFRGLVILSIVLIGVQLVLIGIVANQCTTIHGVAIDGQVMESDSMTCPSKDAEPLYHHGRGLPASARKE